MSEGPEQREEANGSSVSDAKSNRRGIIYAVALGLSFVALSIGFTLYAFPDLSLGRAILAGVFFGAFLALCSITYSVF